MTDTLSRLDVQDFFRNLGQARQSALLLDYDGTLASFRQNRGDAYPYPGVADVLQEIMATGRTRVVLITGRRAPELIPLLNITPHPEIWGTHGLERLHPDDTYERLPVDQDTLETLSAAADWVKSLKVEHLVEHKPGSLAVHWRGLAEPEADEVRRKVMLGWLSIADRSSLTVEQFDGGVEMRMATYNKGDALQTVLAEMDFDAPVAYLGDDQSDEDAFQLLSDRGLTVLVRPEWRDTAAKLWLRPPVQLLSFFRDWLAACEQVPFGRSTRWATDNDIGLRSDWGNDGQRPDR